MRALRERLGASFTALGAVFGNADLRRVQLALAGSDIGAWAGTVALSVLAFEAGGTTAVGLVLVLRTVPPALAAPFMGTLADRFPRKRVMVAADLLRAALVGGAAAILFGGWSVYLVYGLVTVVSVLGTAFRPAQAALLPSLARTPDELTAANVASSTVESVAAFAGPALGGILLAASSPAVCYSVCAATYLWSAFLLFPIRESRPAPEEPAPTSFLRDTLAGAQTLVSSRSARLVTALITAQVAVGAMLFVLLVPLAFEALKTGEDGFGGLLGALGVGGVIGAAVALGLVGRRLSTGLTVGVFLWGAPIALLPALKSQAGAVVLLGIVGIANTLVDVSAFTLLQRAVPEDVLARVFAILESLVFAATALGGIFAPLLLSLVGLDWTLVATGLFLPVVAVASWRAIARIDAKEPAPALMLQLLDGVPFLKPLPAQVLERLSARLARMDVAAADSIFRQGDDGDRFYIIAEGIVDIHVDGQRAPELGPGDYFGEIALVRDVPRTATATASTAATLYALEREDFLAAVTGHAPSASAADAVASARLGALRPVVTAPI